MIKIIVEIEKKKSELEIDGIGEQILITDVIPNIKKGTPGLKKANQAEVVKRLISDMLKTFVRQKAELWRDN